MNLDFIDPGLLLENLPTGVVVHAEDTRILYANSRALTLLRQSEAQALGRKALQPEWNLIDENGVRLEVDEYPVNRVLATDEVITDMIIGIVDADQPDPTWVMLNAYSDRAETGARQVVVIFSDISDQLRIPFRKIIDLANDAVVVTEARSIDAPGPRVVYVNRAFSTLTGYQSVEVVGKSPRILQGELTDRASLERIRNALAQHQPVRETLVNYSKEGTPYWLDININPLFDHSGQVTHFVAIERDVSSTQFEAEKLRNAAATDALTGLLNRRGLDEGVEGLPEFSMGKPGALLMADFDHFKRINDSHGHAEGDRLLCELALMMKEVFRQEDICARYGGEEFVVLLPGISLAAAMSIAERWRESICAQLKTQDEKPVTISIGVTQRRDRESLETLLKRADGALYEAKRAGRNRVVAA